MTANEILDIPVTAPFKLLPRNAGERGKKFRELAKTWHPDRCGDTKVFAHLSALNDAAEKLEAANTLTLKSKEGKTYQIVAQRLRRFELGTVAICSKYVAFLIDDKNEDLVINGIKRLGSIRYPNPKLQHEHERYVPMIEKYFETETQHVVIFHKTPDVLSLRDVLDHFGGAIDPRHVAWIISSLLNLTCFYQVIDLCHNGLSLDTVFISPEFHTAFPIGGWWYATRDGAEIKALPPDVHGVTPSDILASKHSDHRIDLESIRAIARQCIGSDMSKIPKRFADYIRLPAPRDPIADYGYWPRVREDSFGPRRFLKLELTASDIYG
jgi:hypothetical protein